MTMTQNTEAQPMTTIQKNLLNRAANDAFACGDNKTGYAVREYYRCTEGYMTALANDDEEGRLRWLRKCERAVETIGFDPLA